MVTYLFDTYAWIEYFIGSRKGRRIEDVLKDKRATVLTAELIVGEVFAWSLREDHDFSLALQLMESASSFVDVILNDWVVAAHARHEMRLSGRKDFGMVDAVLLAVQQRTGATIVTGDPHFEGLPNVQML